MHKARMINGWAGWAHAGFFEVNWSVSNIELGHIANGIIHELNIKINTDEYDLLRRWEHGAIKILDNIDKVK